MAKAPVRSFTILTLAAVAAGASAMHPIVDTEDRALPVDAAPGEGAVEKRADDGLLQPCVDVAPRVRAQGSKTPSTADASNCPMNGRKTGGPGVG